MSYYDKIYKLRLDRYGLDYQSRIQSKREKEFQAYLKRSVYRVEFEYDNKTYIGSFEKYRQNETKALHYLLTEVTTMLNPGIILPFTNVNGETEYWMVYYLEDMKASGYNRYTMLKMTHYISWLARDGETYTTWAYFYGQEDNMLKDELKSRSRVDTLYNENLKSSFFVCPMNPDINKDDYFIVGQAPIQEYYRVTGYDRQSTDGVEYVSVDPVYEYDLTPPPQKQQGDNDKDFFWLNGGESS